MNLAENIRRLRLDHNMSQDELSEILDVSRQSISKWENGMAVPDLDKLVKMSRHFGITLDQLVGNAAAEEARQPEETPASRHADTPHKTIGWVLFATGMVVFLVVSLLGGLLTGLVLCLPLTVPGMICLCTKKRVGLKCAWAEFTLITTYLTFATGTSWSSLLGYLRNWNILMSAGMNPIHPLMALAETAVLAVLLICTVRSYNKTLQPVSKRGKVLLVAGWALWLTGFLPYPLSIDMTSRWFHLVTVAISWGRLVLFAVLLVFTFRLWRWHRARKN